MSKVLGPIHYWLYGKIENQEELTRAVAEKAIADGKITSADEYTKVLPPLETVIDESNIHGWLQAQIADSESRFAKLVTELLDDDVTYLVNICDAAHDFGAKHAISAEAGADEAYKAFDDFFVNGMPCDRVNDVSERTPERTAWSLTQDVHAANWPDGDTDTYYTVRLSAMDGMLDGTRLEIEMPDAEHYIIKLKEA